MEFRLEGSRDDKGAVRVNEFVDFLSNVNKCLRRLETSISKKGKLSTIYRITNLKTGSATIGIEAMPYKETEDYSASIFDRFTEGVTSIQEDVFPEWIDEELLEDFKELTKPLSKHITTIEVQRNGQTFEVTKQLEVNIEKVLKEWLYTSKGTITGHLDSLNVHSKDQFHIYPPIGPTRIKCNFQDELLCKIKDGIKRYVSVAGTMHFKQGITFPVEIDVEDIEIYPLEDNTQPLDSIRGMAPEITGELDPVVFVKKLRDEYDD